MNILTQRVEPPTSPSATLKPLHTNAPPSHLPSTDEPVKRSSGDESPPLPQIPPIDTGLSEPSDATRRVLTPITEGGSGSDRDPSRPIVSGPPVASSPLQNNTSALHTDEGEGEAQVLEMPALASPDQLSPPSVYAPTEVPSVPVSPPQGHSRELSRHTSVAEPSLETTPLTATLFSERPLVDNNQPSDVRIPSPTSVRSMHSTSAPSLSPANSSNPPVSVSPVQPTPRTPSPGFSILTSPHSVVESPHRRIAFADIENRGERARLSIHSLTSPTFYSAVLPPPNLGQVPIEMNKEAHGEEAHDITGALYYIHQFDQDSAETSARHAEAESSREVSSETDNEIPQPVRFTQPTILPLRPKGTSPPPQPQPTSPRSLLTHVDTNHHRNPPIQPIPRTPTLDYSPDRRPAGARAAPGSNRQETSTWGIQPPRNHTIRTDRNTQPRNMSHLEDPDADALAALAFLGRHDDAPVSSSPPPSRPQQPPPAVVEPEIRSPTPEGESASAYKSSFAPSKNAMQRKARTEAQQAAHEAATHRPGRGSGSAKNRHKASGAWGDSSEEEEEEEDDEDVDSDGQPVAPRDDLSVSPSANQRSQYSSPRGPSPLASGDAPSNQPHPRPPRNLPPVPTSRVQSLSLVLPNCMLVLMFCLVSLRL
jgi:CCR4-NOT transcriptional complex subunit CAF120